MDGYLARRWNQQSSLGALLDPLADKLLVSTTLLLLVEDACSPKVTLPAMAILARELGVSSLREWAQKHRPEARNCVDLGRSSQAAGRVSVAWHGKAKAALQLLALQGLLLAAADEEDGAVKKGSLYLLWLAAGFTTASGLQYAWALRRASFLSQFEAVSGEETQRKGLVRAVRDLDAMWGSSF